MPSDFHRVMLIPAAVFVITFVALAAMLKSGIASKLAVDHPNERSLHSSPVPRTGGLAIQLGLAFAWFCLYPGFLGLACLTALLSAASFWDDRHDLPVAARLTLHCTAALVFVLLVVPNTVPMVFAAALGTAWMTNLYNFMDGSDGLAGGMTLFGFAFFALAAWLAGDADFAVMNLSIATAAVAFLMFNFPPARVFMGDVGSIPIGFLAGASGVWGWHRGYWPFWFPVLVFSPFIFDATITLLRRMVRGERVWQAHREHYYQRLVRMGWGHRHTAYAEYALMILVGASAVAALRLSPALQWIMITLWLFVFVVAMAVIDARWNRFQERQC